MALQDIDERRERIVQYNEQKARAMTAARAWRDIADHVSRTFNSDNDVADEAKIFAVRLLNNTAKKYDYEADSLAHRVATLEQLLRNA